MGDEDTGAVATTTREPQLKYDADGNAYWDYGDDTDAPGDRSADASGDDGADAAADDGSADASGDDGADASADDGSADASADDGSADASADDGSADASADDGSADASADDGSADASADDGSADVSAVAAGTDGGQATGDPEIAQYAFAGAGADGDASNAVASADTTAEPEGSSHDFEDEPENVEGKRENRAAIINQARSEAKSRLSKHVSDITSVVQRFQTNVNNDITALEADPSIEPIDFASTVTEAVLSFFPGAKEASEAVKAGIKIFVKVMTEEIPKTYNDHLDKSVKKAKAALTNYSSALVTAVIDGTKNAENEALGALDQAIEEAVGQDSELYDQTTQSPGAICDAIGISQETAAGAIYQGLQAQWVEELTYIRELVKNGDTPFWRDIARQNAQKARTSYQGQ